MTDPHSSHTERSGFAEHRGGPQDDRALMIGVAAGDRAALAEIYERYSPVVHELAQQRCEPDQVPEIVRQVFMRVWRDPNGVALVNSSLCPALTSSAHRLATGVQRRNRAHLNGPDHVDEFARAPTATGPLRKESELPAVPSELLLALPREEREAIAMAYLGGRSYREVAAVLGETEAVVKTRLRTGLARLHRLCDACRPQPE